MKKIIFLITFAIFLTTYGSASAIERTAVSNNTERVRAATEGANKNLPGLKIIKENNFQKQQDRVATAEGKMTNLKERAIKEIDRRLKSLNELIKKINKIKKITDSQKATFISQVQTEITNLNTLKTKINANTDSATLKTDTQSITKSYRIYALFMPKINILVSADGLDSLADKLSSIAAALEIKINDAKTKGSEVASLSSQLLEMKAKISSGRTQAANARNAVLSLTPEGYPGNLTNLKSARAMIYNGRKDLQAARKNAGTVIQGLRKLNKELSTTTTSTVSSTTTTTTTP
jgi:hypothetical protein